MRQDLRQLEIQMGLFQPRLQRPEWEALPSETKQIVRPLLAELLEQAAVTQTTLQTQGRSDD